MNTQTDEKRVLNQETRGDEIKRLIEWVSKNWDEWKMLCNPAITETDTRAKRRKWVEALKSFAKADFPTLILVFMTKCYYMEGDARQVVEGAIVQRILSTWDENTIDKFTGYLCKFDNWDARELPISDEKKSEREERHKKEIDDWLNPNKSKQ